MCKSLDSDGKPVTSQDYRAFRLMGEIDTAFEQARLFVSYLPEGVGLPVLLDIDQHVADCATSLGLSYGIPDDGSGAAPVDALQRMTQGISLVVGEVMNLSDEELSGGEHKLFELSVRIGDVRDRLNELFLDLNTTAN